MRRIVIVVVVLVAAFAVVLVARLTSNQLPTSAVLAYEFQAGKKATYDVTLVVTDTVDVGSKPASSVTNVKVATHEEILSTDANGGANVRVTVDQPTVQVDGNQVTVAPIGLNTAELHISKDGHVQTLRFPGVTKTISITTQGGKNDVTQVGSTSGQGSTQPLQTILTLVENSLPSVPTGTVNVGQEWKQSSVINAPYMILEAALANSRLDGFEQDNDLRIARIVSQATSPIDLQTYQATGAPLRVKGSQNLHVTAYFVPEVGGIVRMAGTGHMDLTQTLTSGSGAVKSGGFTITQAPVHSVTDLSFNATLRQS